MLSDGALQAYLCNLRSQARRRGVGKKLVHETFARSGAERIDLLALDNSAAFYASFPHRTMPGYRIYPGSQPS